MPTSSSLSTVLARLADLERMQAEIAAERDELLIAKRVLERLEASAHVQSSSERPASLKSAYLASIASGQDVERSRPPTLPEYFLKALQDAVPPWLTAVDVQRVASELKGSEIPMSSVSPTLTELKNKGLIVRDGLKVALASRVGSIEAPTSGLMEAS